MVVNQPITQKTQPIINMCEYNTVMYTSYAMIYAKAISSQVISRYSLKFQACLFLFHTIPGISLFLPQFSYLPEFNTVTPQRAHINEAGKTSNGISFHLIITSTVRHCSNTDARLLHGSMLHMLVLMPTKKLW